MKNKLTISTNKTLKLSNVLIRKIRLQTIENISEEVYLLEDYIKSIGATPIGPIIQHTGSIINEDGEIDVFIQLLRQCNKFISKVESYYHMKPTIRIKNCMYCRYVGEESKLKFAYDKINLTAFEEDIPLKGDSYTILVDQQDDRIVADIFMERAD